MEERYETLVFDSLNKVQQKKLAVKILLWFYKEKLHDLPDLMKNDLKSHVHNILKSHSQKSSKDGLNNFNNVNASFENKSTLSDENNTDFLELPSTTSTCHIQSTKKQVLKMLCTTDSESDMSVLKNVNMSNNSDTCLSIQHTKFAKRNPVSCSTK